MVFKKKEKSKAIVFIDSIDRTLSNLEIELKEGVSKLTGRKPVKRQAKKEFK